MLLRLLLGNSPIPSTLRLCIDYKRQCHPDWSPKAGSDPLLDVRSTARKVLGELAVELVAGGATPDQAHKGVVGKGGVVHVCEIEDICFLCRHDSQTEKVC